MNQRSFFSQQHLSDLSEFLTILHSDERGDNENLGRLLILALILIPLVILIVVFGNDIATKAKTAWDSLAGSGVTAPD
jgi:hypothetical protein